MSQNNVAMTNEESAPAVAGGAEQSEDAEGLLSKEAVEAFLNERSTRNEWKSKLREKNLAANENRPDEAFLRKLDSNLKKTTAYVKKLKTVRDFPC